MIKIRTVTKVSRQIKVPEILSDLKSDMTDEEVLEKNGLHRRQLSKIYSRLFYGGFLDQNDLLRRFEMRRGRDASHIPLVRMGGRRITYECSACGFYTMYHFSACPRCRAVNLRRLSKNSPRVEAAGLAGSASPV